MDYTNMNRKTNQVHAGAEAAEYDAGLRAYMQKVYNYMSVALAITGLVAFLLASSESAMMAIFGSPLKWVVMFAPLAFAFFFGFKVQNMSFSTAQTCLWIFAGLMGLSLSTIFVAYTGSSIARVFFITASLFLVMSLYGYSTKRDLTGLGSFLMMGVIGIVIASIVNIFMQSTGLQMAISIIAVLLFTGLTAYDTQKTKQIYYMVAGNAEASGKAAVMGALNLYMDFINLFVALIQLIGERR